MKVTILLNLPKTIDGEKIGPFRKGQECDLADDIARKFIASAMAEEYREPVEPAEEEPKAEESEQPVTAADDGEAVEQSDQQAEGDSGSETGTGEETKARRRSSKRALKDDE